MADLDEDLSQPSWQDFTQDTTMHGIRYVKMKGVTKLRRVTWTVVLILSLGYFCFGASLLLNDFARKKTVTKLKLKNADSLTFPTVTICNRNYWKRSAIVREEFPPGVAETMGDLLADLFALNRQTSNINEKYDWGSEAMHILGVNDSQDEAETIAFLGNMSHSAEETFKYCFVNAQMVNCNDLFVTVKTDAGFCFRYNKDGDVTANVAGAMGGLMLALDAKVHEYYVGPYSYSEGFAVAVHHKDEEPIMTGLSYSAGVSADTSLIVRTTETKRIPPPADYGDADCFDTETIPNPLHYYQIYSEQGCKIECETAYTLNQCGCRRFLSPPLNDTWCCSLRDQLVCVKPALGRFRTDPKILRACNCGTPCHDIKYSAVTSSLKFPNPQFTAMTINDANFEEMKDNWAMITIYYGQMSYEMIEEKLAISAVDFVAAFGGTLGVAIGGSFLTLIEFIEFAILSLTSVITKHRVAADKNEDQPGEKTHTPVRAFRNSLADDPHYSAFNNQGSRGVLNGKHS